MATEKLIGHFLPDNKTPTIEEIDQGDGIRKLVIHYPNEQLSDRSPVLDVFQFLPRPVEPAKSKSFPWHDFFVYAITSAPMLCTLLFARELMSFHGFVPAGIGSFAWMWFVFLVNLK